jgi:DNA-directed RNA polymerase specialized sigma24 family protein
MVRLGSGSVEWSRIEPWDFIVVHVASEYHKKYEMVELEDIKQALYEWFPMHANNLSDWEELDKKDAKNLIYRSLRNRAIDYCQYWKAKSIGYDVSDLYYYEPDLVEALLPPVLRGEWGVTHKLNLGRPGRPSAPSEGGNLQAMMVEVDNAYRKLNDQDKRLLFLRYAESMEFADIATELDGNSSDAVRMRATRAVRKLINKIGGFRPYQDVDRPDREARDEQVEEQDESVEP